MILCIDLVHRREVQRTYPAWNTIKQQAGGSLFHKVSQVETFKLDRNRMGLFHSWKTSHAPPTSCVAGDAQHSSVGGQGRHCNRKEAECQ